MFWFCHPLLILSQILFWNNYKCFLLEHEIDEEAFLKLNNDVLRDLIPLVGRRLKFLDKFNQFVNTTRYVHAASSSTSTVQSDSEEQQSTSNLQAAYRKSKRAYPFKGEENMKRAFRNTYQLDLESFLKATSQGRFILNSYKREGRLCRKTRNVLVEMLTKEAINDSGK